jgi:3-phenylpropionate/trans-cinnamate dioxygenase ferredoxin reductase component
MAAPTTFAIMGGGLAGAKAAEALRTGGFDGHVVLISEETVRPYDRPPLSKDYLQGKSEKEKIYIHPVEWYADHNVELRLDSRVAAIDRATHQLRLQGGGQIEYERLLVATGSSPRHLGVPGSDLGGVFYLRNVDDYEAIKSAFAQASRVAIIGAGWIGLEVAAAARTADTEVTLPETAKLPLLGVLGPELAEIYRALHTEHGVELRMDIQVDAIIDVDHRAGRVRLTDGTQVDADMVVVGVGITPNIETAKAAGLTVDNGIVVDEYLCSSDPDVFAAGDVANAYYPLLGRHLRLEHWSAALNQGPVAAANMMGRTSAYDRVPYIFSKPIRHGDGVHGLRRIWPLRPGRLPRGRGQSRVHRVLAPPGAGARWHERQRMGCQRCNFRLGPLRWPGRRDPFGGPRDSPERPHRNDPPVSEPVDEPQRVGDWHGPRVCTGVR